MYSTVTWLSLTQTTRVFQRRVFCIRKFMKQRRERDVPYMEQQDENPLYEPATTEDAGVNPIYDRFVFLSETVIFYFLRVIWNIPIKTISATYTTLLLGIVW